MQKTLANAAEYESVLNDMRPRLFWSLSGAYRYYTHSHRAIFTNIYLLILKAVIRIPQTF